MIKKMIEPIIKERIRIADETQDNWDYGIEQCWKKEIDILTNDIEKSMAYFLNDCSDEDFFWIAEIFEEIIEKTQSKKMLQCFRTRLSFVISEKYNKDTFSSKYMRKWVDYAEYVRSVSMDIEYAESKIKTNEK